MPRRIFSHGRILWTSAVTIALYYIGYVLFGPDPPRILVTSLLIGTLAAIHVGLFRPAMDAFRRGIADGGDNVLFSQWGVYSLLLYYFLWVQLSTFLRLSGVDPEYLRNLPIGGTFTTLFLIVGAFTVLAPLNEKIEIEPPSLRRWAWALAFGGVVAGVVGTLSFMRIIRYV